MDFLAENLMTQGRDVAVFQTPSTVTNLQWQTWRKPKSSALTRIWILAAAGGSGGGSGFTRTAGSAGGGGGGGPSGATTVLFGPLTLIPDVLFIQTGAGGAGAVSGGAGAVGGINSFVCVYPNNDSRNTLVNASGSNPASSGSASSGGAGVVATGANVLSGMALAMQFNWYSVAGNTSPAGGAQTGAAGGDLAIPTTTMALAGTGGGGTTSADFAGGEVTAVGGILVSEARPIRAAAGSNNGSGGICLMKPFWRFGGMGGGSSNAGVGGHGGNGIYGSGGGGGGAGTTGGNGGKGGDGVVIIICS